MPTNGAAPLVTCLCLTRNRRNWLPAAIACFQSQAYANRELLVLADGEDVSDLMPGDDPRVRLIRDGRSEGLTIGAKRNLGCELAMGEIVAHWDDDDHSAPGRITDQAGRLLSSGKAVTGYHSMVFRNSADGLRWRYSGALDYAIGTSLCYLKSWWRTHPFPSVYVGEDNQFVTMTREEGQLITADAGHLMYANIHPGNTSQKIINEVSWARCA
jgi:O-antigen biosynthesis protein